jgi:signal transduction histidine kinase
MITPIKLFLAFKNKKRLTTLSLKSVIILGIAVGILVPALVVGPLLARDSYQREMDARIDALLQQYGNMLEQTMVIQLWQFDVVTAQTFVNAVMLNTSVVSVVVEYTTGRPFVRAENSRRRTGTIVRDVRILKAEGNPIGRVKIEMSRAQIEREFQTNLIKVGAGLLMQLLVSCLLLFLLFERLFMRPLRQLGKDTLRLAKSELVDPVLPMRQDEIGRLAIGLDQMREKLGEQIIQIRDFNASLEQRVDDRTHALNVANHELQSALATLKTVQEEIQRSDRLAALGALVAGVAHELNTPIGNSVTVASTMLDLSVSFMNTIDAGMTRSKLAAYTQQTKQASEMLVRNLNRAAELIGSFKQVAVDRTSVRKRIFILDEVVGETVLLMYNSMKRTQHVITTDIAANLKMNSYPGPLGQILSNLCNNALLHGFENTPQGTIHISASLLPEKQVEMVVSDNGGGIPEANISRIFDPFFTTKLGHGGSGLGLSIVYNLVTVVLGGSISVESTLNNGARFVILLPVSAPDEAQAQAGERRHGERRQGDGRIEL